MSKNSNRLSLFLIFLFLAMVRNETDQEQPNEPEAKTESFKFNINDFEEVEDIDKVHDQEREDGTLILFIKNNIYAGNDYQTEVQQFLNNLEMSRIDDHVTLRSIDCLKFPNFCYHSDYRVSKVLLEVVKRFYTISISQNDLEYEKESTQFVLKEVLLKEVHRPENFQELEKFINNFYSQREHFMFVLLNLPSYDVEFFKRMILLIRTANAFAFKEIVWVIGTGIDFQGRDDMIGVHIRFWAQSIKDAHERALDPLGGFYGYEDSLWVELETTIERAEDHSGDGFIKDKDREENVHELITEMNKKVYEDPIFIDSTNFLAFETKLFEHKIYLISNNKPKLAKKFMKFGRTYNREALEYQKVSFGVLDHQTMDQDYLISNYSKRFGDEVLENKNQTRIIMTGPKRNRGNVDVEFINRNVFVDEDDEMYGKEPNQRPKLQYKSLERFILNFFDNKYTETFLRNEMRNSDEHIIKGSDQVVRFDGRGLAAKMKSSKWDKDLILMICHNEQEIDCQIAAKFFEYIQFPDSNKVADLGFIDIYKNDVGETFLDGLMSPRFYLIKKNKRFRPEIFNQQFAFENLINWVNKGSKNSLLSFDEDRKKEFMLEVAKINNQEEQVKQVLENQNDSLEDL